jgi:hypothetical protein
MSPTGTAGKCREEWFSGSTKVATAVSGTAGQHRLEKGAALPGSKATLTRNRRHRCRIVSPIPLPVPESESFGEFGERATQPPVL